MVHLTMYDRVYIISVVRSIRKQVPGHVRRALLSIDLAFLTLSILLLYTVIMTIAIFTSLLSFRLIDHVRFVS